MRNFFSGLVCIIILSICAAASAQSTGVYEIFWNALDETELQLYHVYYEERDSMNANFTLFDGLDPTEPGIDIDPFHVDQVIPVGQSQYIYEMVLNNDDKWVKVGIIGQDALGRVYLMGGNFAPVQKQGTVLPGPSGVGFRLKVQ